jgi:hypothetical protein
MRGNGTFALDPIKTTPEEAVQPPPNHSGGGGCSGSGSTWPIPLDVVCSLGALDDRFGVEGNPSFIVRKSAAVGCIAEIRQSGWVCRQSAG